MRNFIKRITHPILKFFFNRYFSKPRKFTYKEITVSVHPEVFPPHYTLSTKILLDYIHTLDIVSKTFLELGCGSGIISLFAASKGAVVTATDINQTALDALEKASEKNNLKIDILYSDLFEAIQKKGFDLIVINPPYYPKAAKNVKEQAWFCGEHFEYFEYLFQQIRHRKNDGTILMILSEDCDLKKIKEIANTNHLQLTCVLEKKTAMEKNFIFKIHLKNLL